MTNRPGSPFNSLTLLCVPACDSVLVKGKNLGPSPIVRLALPAGTVGVELRRGDIRKHIGVHIVAGQTAAHRIQMEKSEDGVVDPWR